jgi:hypothetical protein
MSRTTRNPESAPPPVRDKTDTLDTGRTVVGCGAQPLSKARPSACGTMNATPTSTFRSSLVRLNRAKPATAAARRIPNISIASRSDAALAHEVRRRVVLLQVRKDRS